MAAESRKEPEQEPVEALIDDLIRELLSDANQSPKTAARGPLAALIETVMVPSRGTLSRASTLERLLFTQTIASALADALAPALAETLTPEILKALEHYAAGESRGGEPTAAGEGARRASA
jgi:hypothetical protein